jgi:hypothetical protein
VRPVLQKAGVKEPKGSVTRDRKESNRSRHLTTVILKFACMVITFKKNCSTIRQCFTSEIFDSIDSFHEEDCAEIVSVVSPRSKSRASNLL